jgi:tetratricopeptide (TPR) repeat protein
MRNLILALFLIFSCNHLFAQNSEEYYEEGKKYSDSKDFFLAALSYSKAIQLNPYDWRYYQSRSWAYFKSKNFKDALSDINKSLDLKPMYNNYEAINIRATILLENGNYKEAIDDWTYIITYFPDEFITKYGIAHFFRGKALLYSNQKNKACSDFHEAHLRKMGDAKSFIDKFCN